MKTEWILMLFMGTGDALVPPYLESKGYVTKEQCQEAGDLIAAADMKASKREPSLILCQEQEKS